MTRFVAASVVVYGHLLRLCPGELRTEFGEEMALVLSDDLADSYQHGGPAAACRVWLRAVAELAPLAASNALSIHGVLTSLIASALSILCFSAELAVARAHGPSRISTAPPYVTVVLILIPGIAAALVAFIASRMGLRSAPQRFLN